MRFSIAIVLAAAGLATAQTTTGGAAAVPSSNCAAQNIVEACKSTTQIQVDNCPVQDWGCLCEAYKTVLTCYNSCPGDPNRYATEAQMTANCNAADSQSSIRAALSTTASGTTQAAVSSGSPGSSGSSPPEAAGSGSATHSGSRSATSSGFSSNTGTNAADAFAVPAAGGVFAAVLGLAAML